MDAEGNDTPRRPRADFIRECLAAGLSPKEIRARCVAAHYPEPKPEAIYRAKTYKTKGRPLASRPSYYTLWREFLAEYDRAYRKHILLGITGKMKEIIDCADLCVTQDLSREPITPRRKRKRK